MQTFIGLTLLGAFIALVVGVTLFLATPGTRAIGKHSIVGALLAFAVGFGGLLVLSSDAESDATKISRFNSPAPLSASPDTIQAISSENVVQTASAQDEGCRLDLDCWGGRNTMQAAFHCNIAVEEKVQNPFRWTHTFGSPKFDSYRWHNEKTGQLVYQGSRFEVQGNNGVWAVQQYECAYDPAKNQVLTVQLSATNS